MERLRPGAVRACMQYALQGDAGASQSFGAGIARTVGKNREFLEH